MWHYIVLAMGWVIKCIYELFHNYGVAIILFTLLFKLLLLPLNVKSQKAMKKQQKIQPIVMELQKKYANDQAKLQQEMAKLYKENGVSMTGGCLPMLIQMPILLALYQAIRRPLTYMFNVPYKDIPQDILTKVDALKAGMLEKFPELVSASDRQLDAAQLLNQSQIQLSDWAHRLFDNSHEWYINFNFLGLDLSKTPWTIMNYLNDLGNHMDLVMLMIIPVLAVVSGVAVNKVTMKMSGQAQNKDNANDQAAAMNKTMMWMMPLMTAYFTLILPAGIGLYWIISSLTQILQQVILYYHLEKKGEDFEIKVPEKKYQHGKKSKKH